MKIDKYTVGSDPELFLYDTKEEMIISSDGIIPGKKGAPHRSADMPEGFGLEVDNILAEFNIPPCTTLYEWVYCIQYMKDYIKNFVQRINPHLTTLSIASAFIHESQLQSDVAKLFGCSEDFNVYTEDVNPKPEGTSTNLRSTGCHIHFGYDHPNIADSFKLLKYFDMYLGIPSILLDSDSNRRTLYGKAGCFRLTPYGFEYRVLSGAFIDNVPLMEFMWNGVANAVSAFNMEVPLLDSELVQNVINTSDVKTAEYLCKTNKLI